MKEKQDHERLYDEYQDEFASEDEILEQLKEIKEKLKILLDDLEQD